MCGSLRLRSTPFAGLPTMPSISMAAAPTRSSGCVSGSTASMAGAHGRMPVERAFADIVARFEIPRALPEALLDGLAWDAEGRRYQRSRGAERLFGAGGRDRRRHDGSAHGCAGPRAPCARLRPRRRHAAHQYRARRWRGRAGRSHLFAARLAASGWDRRGSLGRRASFHRGSPHRDLAAARRSGGSLPPRGPRHRRAAARMPPRHSRRAVALCRNWPRARAVPASIR